MEAVKSKDALKSKNKNGDIKPENPKNYKVFIINDDTTPMDFVVDVLKKVFNMKPWTADVIMMSAHHNGRALCGCYHFDIAHTKAEQAHEIAAAGNYPLRCDVEEE